MIKKLFVMLACFSLVGCTIIPRDMQISPYIGALMSDEKSPPFSGVVMVEQDDLLIVDKVRIYKDIPMDMNFSFIIGDVSKQMTAALVLRLVDQGKLSLHAPMRSYLQEMGTQAGKATIHQLLTHTTGPGNRFMYSDANYDLLGKIIARVTLSSFEEQLEEMTKICQMKDTFAKERGDALFFKNLYPQFMEGWREGRRGKFIHSFMVRNPAQNPSQGIISTPKDMIRWARCLHGNLNENDLLSPASYKKMMTSYVDIDHRWKNLGYGYGVQVTKVFGSTEISHSGIVPGFKTTLIYYPEEKIAALVMENLTLKNNPREFAIHDGVRKIIIDRLIAPPPKEVFMKR